MAGVDSGTGSLRLSDLASPPRHLDLMLVRHPQVAVAPGVCYGQLDVPLQQPPQPPLVDVLQRLQGLLTEAGSGSVQAVHSSSLQRAAWLAQALAQAHAAPLRLDARWQELHFGAWEGRAWADIPRHQSDAWAADYHHQAPPGGETHAALVERVRAALADLLPDNPLVVPPGPVLVVSHAGPLRCVLAAALGLPAHEQPDASLRVGGWLWLRAWHDSLRWRWTLKGWNR